MNKQWRRILDIAKKTGDTLIVTDPEGEDVFVVMGIDKYENLRDIREEKEEAPHVVSQEKANISKENQEMAEAIMEEFVHQVERMPVDDGTMRSLAEEGAADAKDIWSTMVPANGAEETWNLEELSEEELSGLKEEYEKYTQEDFGTKTEKPQTEELDLENQLNLDEIDEEIGEEQFYLEPIE